MNPRAYGDEFVLAVRHYLQTNNLKSLGQINAEILADLSQKFHDHHEAQQKQRKKKEIGGPVEREIYQAYPRHVAPQNAYAAIRLALGKTDCGHLKERVQKFASCVARWPASYRYKEGRDLVPHPATWFNRGSWEESEKEWLPAGMFTQEQDRAGGGSPQRQDSPLPEPQGWRDIFKDYIHKDRPWSQLDRTTQQHITSQMNQP